jgi:hypothetical protein
MATDLQKMASRSFWQRPEGKTGLVLAAGAVGAGGYALYKLLPVLIVLLENTLYAALLGAGVFLVTSPIWSTKVRTLCGYMLRSLCRKITGWFVEIDPIGILKNYVEDLKKSMRTMDAQISNLRGHITGLKNIIAKNEAEAEKSLRLAGAAQQQGQKAAFVLNARKQGRLEQSNMTLQALQTKMEALYKLLNKLRETSDVMVQDMESEVQVKEQERNAIRAGYGAFTAAVRVMRGDPDRRALFDQAMEHLANDYAQKVGEIEHFMDASKGFIASVDLENLAFEQEALEKLNQLEARTEQLLLGPGQPRVAIPEIVDAETVPVGTSRGVYDLFAKKEKQ